MGSLGNPGWSEVVTRMGGRSTLQAGAGEVMGQAPPGHPQWQTPYFDAIVDYAKSGVTTFTCPGHQQGVGAPDRLRDFLGPAVLAADSTEVPGLDDLHQPTGVLRAAQELAAEAYGADESYFLVNGSTSGNHIMILAAVKPGETLIMPRNMHKSAAAALILSGARPVYLEPAHDEDLDVDHTVPAAAYAAALAAHPEAKAVFVISPTYYGACADLPAIVAAARERSVPVLVDEAWGPHLHFHPDLPMSATAAGADLCVNSTHKLIGGLSQASILHRVGPRVDPWRVQAVQRMLLSASPNAILLASIDAARMQMATEGRALLDRTIALAHQARRGLSAIPGVHVWGPGELAGRPGVAAVDSTRLVWSAADLGCTGFELERMLRFQYNMQIELSDLRNVVALITIGHREADISRLVGAMSDIAGRRPGAANRESAPWPQKNGSRPHAPARPPVRMTPRDAFMADSDTIPFAQAAGRVCAEFVIPYPPGIPALCPGEEITQDLIEYLRLEVDAGAHIQGAYDPALENIRTVTRA